jgi:GLPGLI family protein
MKLIASLCFVFLYVGISAQNNEGHVLYEEKINIWRNLPPRMEDMKDRIPEFRKVEKVLYFNATESLYTNPPKEEKEEDEVTDVSREGRWKRRMGRGRSESVLYRNLEEKTALEEKNFFGKVFLVDGGEEPIQWKVTGEQKQVGSYLCMQAVFSDSTRNIEAWFTPMIPVAAGPQNFVNLPGLVLHVDINKGERSYTAQNINLEKLDMALIQKPTKGQKVTREKFKKITEEKMKEMEAERGGRGGMRFWRQ